MLKRTAYGQPVRLEWKASDLESVHVEYDYPFEKKYKYNVGYSTNDESYWLHPLNKRTQLTKISFATEKIYFLALEKNKIQISTTLKNGLRRIVRCKPFDFFHFVSSRLFFCSQSACGAYCLHRFSSF